MIIKDYLIRSALIMFTALFLAGCLNPFDSGSGDKSSATTGTLTVSLSDGISAQTLLPDLDMNVASYQIDGTGPGGESFSVSTDQTTVTVESLAFGEWSVAVSALNGDEVVIGTGSSTVMVNTGETSTASVTVRPIDGTGTLDLSVEWNDGDIQTPSIDAGLTPAGGATVDLGFTVDGSSASYASSTIATGYHTLALQLLDNGIVTAGAVEVVRIVDGATTRGSYLFDEVNKPGGTIDVEITPEMAEPLTVTISGEQSTVELGQSLDLAASVAEPVSAVYVWYVNGASVATGESFTFAADEYGLGYYRIDVTAFSADGTRAGSGTIFVEVVAQESQQLPLVKENQIIDQIYQAREILTGPEGNIYVFANSDLYRIDPNDYSYGFLTTISASAGHRSDTMLGNDGRIYVRDTSRIVAVDVYDLEEDVITTNSDGTEPQITNYASGLVEDDRGMLLFVDSDVWQVNGIIQVDPESGVRSYFASETIGSGPFPYTYEGGQIALDSNGNILLFGDDEIIRVDKDTKDRTELTLLGDTISGSLGSPDNILQISDTEYLAVYRYATWWFGHNSGTYDAHLRRITVTGSTATYENVSGLAGSRPDPDWIGNGTMFIYPTDVAVSTSGDFLVMDANLPGIIGVDPDTGNRKQLWNPSKSVGYGFGFAEPTVMASDGNDHVYVADFETHQHDGHKAILRFNTQSGNRELISANFYGSGPFFDYYDEIVTGMIFEDGHLLIRTFDSSNSNEEKIYEVDVTTGARTIVSETYTFPDADSVTTSSGSVIAIDQNSRIVEVIDGNETVLASEDVGVGPKLRAPGGLFVLDYQTLFVSDQLMNAIVRIDLSTLKRTIVSGIALY